MPRKRKPQTITFRPPFRASGNFVLDSCGMVLAQFMPIEQILVGGKVRPTAEFVVGALNLFSEAYHPHREGRLEYKYPEGKRSEESARS